MTRGLSFRESIRAISIASIIALLLLAIGGLASHELVRVLDPADYLILIIAALCWPTMVIARRARPHVRRDAWPDESNDWSDSMHPRTFFTLLLKGIGVWLIVQSIVSMSGLLPMIIAALGVPNWSGRQMSAYLAPPVLYLISGLYLFFGGQFVVDLAVPARRPSCPDCGYDITRVTTGRCPECGNTLRRRTAPPTTTPDANPPA